MQCEKYTQAAFMTLSPDNIFRLTTGIFSIDKIPWMISYELALLSPH